MTRKTNAVYVFIGALVVLVASLAWSLTLLAHEPGRRQALRQTEARMMRLEPLMRMARTLDARRAPFNEASGVADTVAQVDALFTAGNGAEVRIETVGHEGWRLHRVSVTYVSVEYEVLAARIRRAEALRPPLKLVECVLEAAPGKTGAGRAGLRFERIEPGA